MAREKHAVAAVAGRHHAVKHVDTSVDSLKDVGRSADTHQIARTVLGENLVDNLNHVIHDFGRFAYGKTADGIAVSPKIGYEFR